MLKSIVRFSLRHRGVVIALACALLAYGVYSLRTASYDVFPEFAPPEVSIQVEAPGLSPQQVEELVTQPIENAIVGVSGVSVVRSGSIQGLSVINVVFQDTGSVYRDRQLVAERLATLAGQLPAGITPIMTPLTSSASVVMAIGLTSRSLSLMNLTTTADWVVKRRLLAVPGVAKVAVFGAMTRQIQIQFDPGRLIQHGVAVTDVIAAAQRATGIRGAGFVSTANQRVILQSEGQALTPADIAQTVLIHHQGANLTLGDVSKVVNAPAPPVGGVAVMGQPGLMLMVSSQYGANTLEVTRGIDRALAELQPGLEKAGIQLHSDIFRPADFVVTALGNVRGSLLIGGLLVIAVLFLFLFNLRTAAISCAASPLSLLGGVVVLEHFGLSLNTMTLGGLAIAIGEVVDDAVIDVENISRRLRQNRRAPVQQPAIRVVLDASIEVRSAVVYATFAVILGFVPGLTLSGLAGQIFAPLAVAYICALLASLLVALTVTPALAFLLLGNQDLPAKDPPVVGWLKERYAKLLAHVEEWPGVVIVAVALLIVLGVATIPFLKGAFLPELQEGHFIVHMKAVPGTSIQESLRMGRRVTRALMKLPSVSFVAQRVGRAELSDDNAGTFASEFEVGLKIAKRDQNAAARSDIMTVLAKFPGPTFSINTFFTERVNETLSGYNGAVVVNLFGSRLNTRGQEAGEIAAALQKIRGAPSVLVQSPPGMPQVVVQLRRNAITRWGFDPVQVLDALQTAYGGDTVGQIYQGNRVFDVSVILAPRDRQDVAAIGSLPLRSPDGNYVLLRQLADIHESSGRYIVLHDGARRVQTITCNVAGRNVNSFVAEAKSRIARISLPPGTYVEFGGTAAEQARSLRELLVHSLLAGLGIVLLLSVVMGNYRNLLLVLLNLPFALVGGVLAILLMGGEVSLGSMIGFVTLFGITLRNSIMMISHYENLVAEEGMTWGWPAALRGASERLAPILMTALVTGLALLPLALGSGDPGREIEGPMAIVILGGLATSTLLNLLVLPTLALRFGRFEPHREEL